MSFPPYHSYRPSSLSESGTAPSHWKELPVKRAFDVTLGKMVVATSEPEPRSTRPYLRSANVQDGWLALDDTKEMWFSDEEAASLDLRAGDLVICEGGDVGRCTFLKAGLPGFGFQNSVNRARPRDGNSAHFLSFWMRKLKTDGYIDVLCNRSTIAHYTAEKVAATPLLLPPPEEQSAIAAFLDRECGKIDALVAEQERLIALLKEKRQAVISQAVTKGLDPNAPMKASGVEWLGEVPAHWKVMALGRVAERVVVGIAEAAVHAYAEQGVPILRSTNIRAGAIVGDLLYLTPGYAEGRGSKLIRSGDLITVRTGHAGVTAVVPADLDGCQCFTMLITTLAEGHSPEFFCFLLNSHFLREHFSIEAWGSAQPNISVPILKAAPVTVPPAGEQMSIVRHLERMTADFDALMNEAESAIALLKERRAALISAAVTGKIDVRGLVTPEEAKAA